MRNIISWVLIGVVSAAAAGCGAGDRPAEIAPGAPSPETLERAARADSVRRHYTRADVDFMTGMIHHHAQALEMSGMARTHGASAAIRTLAERIINGQRDEIALMQQWLRDRGEPVPDPDAGGSGRPMHAHHADGMAGMLTDEQLARLDAARAEEWDRLFLIYMIQHHQGAITMVERLFATYGAGQGDETFKIASDIGADQASEIDRMQRMLEEMMFGTGVGA